jgi:hypothetical protein
LQIVFIAKYKILSAAQVNFWASLGQLGLGRQNWPADLTGRLDRQTWPADLAGRLGRQTWPADLAGRLGRQTWPAGLAGRLGRQTTLVATLDTYDLFKETLFAQLAPEMQLNQLQLAFSKNFF